MTEVSVGALFGTVELTTVSFDLGYARVVAKMSDLGARSGATAAETAKLDEALVAVSSSATRASTSVARASRSAAEGAAVDQKAALAADRRAAASGRVAAVMADVAGMSTKVQQATLRDLAAQERLTAAQAEGGTSAARQASETARLAGAQASAIGSSERLAAAQRSSVVASNAAAASATRASGAWAGMARTAGQLGLIVGVLATVKAGLDISHQATAFQSDMVKIQTQAGASAGEIQGFSGDILKLAGPTAQAPEALATSLYHVYSATKTLGYTGPQMLNAVTIAAEGATASGADLEETTNALTATMVSGLGSVDDMGAAMGSLNAIVGAGDMKLTDLNEALGTGILAAAKVFGVSLSQAGAALAVFGDNNIRGADAATKLRMVIQDLSKPAAHADDVLGALGLSAASLRADLEEGGLSQALHSLKTHLDAAGVTGSKVGGLIEDAFTKKAGVGLAVLLNNMEQYDQKQVQITKGAGDFGAAWTATTGTARYALTRLWTSLEAGGIVLASKLTPEIATAATWLGTSLPHAIGVLADVLGPTVHMVGVGLVGAWVAAGAVLGPVMSGLGDVGHVLAEQSGLISHVIVPVLAMWAAWKGYQIAVLAIGAVRFAAASMSASVNNSLTSMDAAVVSSARDIEISSTVIDGELVGVAASASDTAAIMQIEFAKIVAADAEMTAARERSTALWLASNADEVASSRASTDAQVADADARATAALASARAAQLAAAQTTLAADEAAAGVVAAGETAAVGWRAMLGPLALIGVSVAALTMMFGGNSDAAANNAAAIQSMTAAIKDDNGVIGQNTELLTANTLAKNGVLESARSLGLVLSDVTSAALGNADAQGRVNAAYDAYRAKVQETIRLSRFGTTAQKATATAALEGGNALSKQGDAWTKVNDAIGGVNKTVSAAVQQYKDVKAASAAATTEANRSTAAAVQSASGWHRVAEANGLTEAALHKTAKAVQAVQESVHWVVDSNGDLILTTKDVGKAADAAAAALTRQTLASKALKLAQDLLNGVNQTAEQTSDAFTIALGGLADKSSLAKDAQGHLSSSLDKTSVAGATNRQMFLGLIQTAQAQAQGVVDVKNKTESYGQALRDGTAQLADNEAALRKVGLEAGFSGKEMDVMFRSLGKLKTAHAEPKVALIDHASGAIARLGPLLDHLDRTVYPTVDILINTIYGAAHVSSSGDVTVPGRGPARSAAGGLTSGPNLGGYYGMVAGPGTGTSDTAGVYALSNREFVATALSVSRNLAALEAGNRGATLVPVGGLTSSSVASVPAVRPVPVSAPVTPGMDLTPVLRRLESLEEAVRSNPREFADASVSGFRAAGREQATMTQRIMRGM